MIQAKYVSVWDDGVVVKTDCLYNPTTNVVSNISTTEDVEGLENLGDEYVVLPNGVELGAEDGVIFDY